MLRATILAGKASDSVSQGCQSHIDLLCEFRVDADTSDGDDVPVPCTLLMCTMVTLSIGILHSVHQGIVERSISEEFRIFAAKKDSPMYPKFILVSDPKKPLVGTFVYGLVVNHKDLARAYEQVHGYVKIHGGGWYEKDDARKTITLYGSSGDYGEPRLLFLNRIPRELEEYAFYYTPIHGLPGNKLDLTDVEWF